MQAFVKDMRAVIKNRKNHFDHEVRCVYARKPYAHEVEEMRRKKEEKENEQRESRGQPADN